MYSQFELDHMDEQTYREFLFWDGQISKEALDNPPQLCYNGQHERH